jgi:hypothetical protein
MALFHDGSISDTTDLQNYESDILSVASVEGIDLNAKMLLAQHELAHKLILFLLRRPPYWRDPWLGGLRERDVKNVVVTGPLRQWHAYQSLAFVYRDAYNNQLNNRYQGKWQEYERLAKASERTYFQIGVGLVPDPVPMASAPTLSSVIGAGTGGTYYVAITWVNATGDEGAPSDLVELTTSDGQQLVVSVGTAPNCVTGWNVYVGTSPENVSLQNATSLPPGGNWTMNAGLSTGVALGNGQKPSWFVVDHRVIERG